MRVAVVFFCLSILFLGNETNALTFKKGEAISSDVTVISHKNSDDLIDEFNKNNASAVNIMVPDDVLTSFLEAPFERKVKHCGARGNKPYREIDQLSKSPPRRIFGYNSRMDNSEYVEGARQTGRFIHFLTEAYTDSWATGSDQKRSAVLDVLYAWARNDALTETTQCVIDGNISDSCTEWTQDDGQDLSDIKDHGTVQMHMMHLAYGYYLTLSDFKPEDSRHRTIQFWIDSFFEGNKAPEDVYFGMDLGWYWPAVLQASVQKTANSSAVSPKDLIEKAVSELEKIVLEDGSFKERTTRGNRALWYHHTALVETLITLEMARKFGIEIPSSLAKRLEKSGEIFIRGFEDHSYMDRWAKTAHNSIFVPGEQDFSDTLDLPNGNSWFYIFSYRYPQNAFTSRLDQILAEYPKNGRRDGYVGFGLGCLYAVAKEANQHDQSVEIKSSIYEKAPTLEVESVWLLHNSDGGNYSGYTFEYGTLETETVSFENGQFTLMIDFKSPEDRENKYPNLLRIELPVSDIIPENNRLQILECSKITFRSNEDVATHIRFLIGNETSKNKCLLDLMLPEAKILVETLGLGIPQIIKGSGGILDWQKDWLLSVYDNTVQFN